MNCNCRCTDLTMQSRRTQTRVIVMVALHCAFTHLTDYSLLRPRGLMRLLQDPPLADFFNVITAQDYDWRYHNYAFYCVIFLYSYIVVGSLTMCLIKFGFWELQAMGGSVIEIEFLLCRVYLSYPE